MEKQVLPCLLVAGSHPAEGLLFQATAVPKHGQRRTPPLIRFLQRRGRGGLVSLKLRVRVFVSAQIVLSTLMN